MKKQILSLFKSGITGLVIVFSLQGHTQAQVKPYGEGLPLPWPFPWAKECPVNWEGLQGRYLLSESALSEQIDLKITVINRQGFRLIRVSRYSAEGDLMSDGFTFVDHEQRAIQVWLNSVVPDDGVRVSAMLQLYYSDADQLCAEGSLVPILTLDRYDHNSHIQTRYRLVRLSDRRD